MSASFILQVKKEADLRRGRGRLRGRGGRGGGAGDLPVVSMEIQAGQSRKMLSLHGSVGWQRQGGGAQTLPETRFTVETRDRIRGGGGWRPQGRWETPQSPDGPRRGSSPRLSVHVTRHPKQPAHVRRHLRDPLQEPGAQSPLSGLLWQHHAPRPGLREPWTWTHLWATE